MNAVAIGPLLFSADRFAAILGVAAFWIAMAIVGRLIDRRLGELAFVMVLAGVLGARLVHVLLHLESFAPEPWRVAYVWHGGFNLWGSLAGLVAIIAWKVRAPQRLAGVAAATIAGFGVWGAVMLLAQQTSGAPLPETMLERRGDAAVALAAFSGRPMVINLWATWCPPCVREMPMMAEAAKDNPGVTFAFVNQGEGTLEIEAFLTKQGLDLETVLLDPFWDVSQHYAARGLPTTLFISADGRIDSVFSGEVSPELMDQRLDALQ